MWYSLYLPWAWFLTIAYLCNLVGPNSQFSFMHWHQTEWDYFKSKRSARYTQPPGCYDTVAASPWQPASMCETHIRVQVCTTHASRTHVTWRHDHVARSKKAWQTANYVALDIWWASLPRASLQSDQSALNNRDVTAARGRQLPLEITAWIYMYGRRFFYVWQQIGTGIFQEKRSHY